ESTLAVVQAVAASGAVAFEHDVIPGVSSVHALTARHRIALNRVGRAVQILPGRLLAGGMPTGVDDVVVMLDAHAAFASIPADGIDIYWGAYLGTPDEILRSGPLADIAAEIVRVRAEAKARKGWMFDTYLLRRR
ncbi:MAG: precorrin-6A synthase, partial [Solirubrobacteraceae bacterium]|nr:precorrin-6A synthase [Solirubrobacteraceae bacterium]